MHSGNRESEVALAWQLFPKLRTNRCLRGCPRFGRARLLPSRKPREIWLGRSLALPNLSILQQALNLRQPMRRRRTARTEGLGMFHGHRQTTLGALSRQLFQDGFSELLRVPLGSQVEDQLALV